MIGYTAGIDSNATVNFEFTMPRSERTCPTGTAKSQPRVTVRMSAGGRRKEWREGMLEESLDARVQDVLQTAIDSEHSLAWDDFTPPVPEDVMVRFRQVDEDATVSEIRDAARAANEMDGQHFSQVDSIALWIARNYIHPAAHEREINDLEDDVFKAGEALNKAEKGGCGCEASISAGEKAQLEAVESLRHHGDTVLQYRPGATVLEQVLDLLDDVGR